MTEEQREKTRARCRRHYWKHAGRYRAKKREQSAKRYRESREAYLASNQKWRAANRERYRLKWLEWSRANNLAVALRGVPEEIREMRTMLFEFRSRLKREGKAA